MKIPKSFFYFLAIAQAILTAGHILLYQCLVFLFPFFAARWLSVLLTLIGLSIIFLLASIADFNSRSGIVRLFYLISSVWIIAWFYLLLAGGLTCVIFLLLPRLDINSLGHLLFGLAGATVIYGIINARVTRTIKINIALPNLPKNWQGKTAVLVSDIHLGHVLRQGFAKKVVLAINLLNPDIIFIPGDFFDGVRTDFEGLAKEFKNLKAPLGAYFCPGNHELYAGPEQCRQAIKNAGISILENRMVEVEGLQIAGSTYSMEETDKNLYQIFSKMALDRNKPSVLIKHVPNHLPSAAKAGFNLQVSGHTHQAQVWPGRYFTSKIFKGFDYGLKKFGPMQVYTSSGVGTWGPPVRILTKSEIVQITFI